MGVLIGGGIRSILAVFFIVCQFFGAFFGALGIRVSEDAPRFVNKSCSLQLCLSGDLYESVHGGTTFLELITGTAGQPTTEAVISRGQVWLGFREELCVYL